MSTWHERYFHRFYAGRPGWRDGTSQFHDLCASLIQSGSKILEIGAGPSNATSRFLAKRGELVGLDPSPEVEGNDALSSAHVLKGPTYPFGSNTFDACVANYVIEHVEDPVAHLREVRRILKPGGVYLIRTPNLLHYVAMTARMTPHWFHELVANRLRGLPKDAHEPYPVVYRMNTQRAFARLSREAGFSIEALQMVEKEPSYGAAARPLFLAFTAYERLVNATEWAAFLRANIFAALRKESAS